MIADKIENLKKYPEFLPYLEQINGFIAKVKTENLPEGRYELLGEEMFALVQYYDSCKRADARMEAHKLYSDIQYILEGEEYIYWNPVDEMTVQEDRTPDADILFYTCTGIKGSTLLQAGMFGCYLPSDGHMPCVAVEDHCAPVKKIVFKIRQQ